MRRKHRINYKKNNNQIINYRNFISDSFYSPQGTVAADNKMLEGSGEFMDDEAFLCHEETKKTSLKYKLSDWIKNNIFPSIIVAIIIGIGGWVINHAISIAMINQRLEYIQTAIDDMKENAVDKENLSLKLDELKTNTNYNFSLQLNEIKWQIKEIENVLGISK